MKNSAFHLTPEHSPLGQSVSYRDTYTKELLFPISRQHKRDELGIPADALPFCGEDVWNAYELSWLNLRGKPLVAMGVFRVPADSPCLIESKSLKLYLNSFNQTRFADATEVCERMRVDLSAACGAEVAVELQALSERSTLALANPRGILLDGLDIDIDCYLPNPAFLSADRASETVTETLYSHLLKSNCLVTGQPDWGMVVVRYTGAPIDRAGLLRYIVSFRNHNEFHEQCVERIFCDIQAYCEPTALAVWARYTRRGGLDINPFRSSGHFDAPPNDPEMRQ